MIGHNGLYRHKAIAPRKKKTVTRETSTSFLKGKTVHSRSPGFALVDKVWILCSFEFMALIDVIFPGDSKFFNNHNQAHHEHIGHHLAYFCLNYTSIFNGP